MIRIIKHSIATGSWITVSCHYLRTKIEISINHYLNCITLTYTNQVRRRILPRENAGLDSKLDPLLDQFPDPSGLRKSYPSEFQRFLAFWPTGDPGICGLDCSTCLVMRMKMPGADEIAAAILQNTPTKAPQAGRC